MMVETNVDAINKPAIFLILSIKGNLEVPITNGRIKSGSLIFMSLKPYRKSEVLNNHIKWTIYIMQNTQRPLLALISFIFRFQSPSTIQLSNIIPNPRLIKKGERGKPNTIIKRLKK